MSAEVALAVVLSAAYATAPFALYLQCVRPNLRWYRGRPQAHVALGMVSLIPAFFLTARWQSPPASVVASAATMAVVAAWFFPHLVVRATGGPAPLDPELAAVTEHLSAAGRLLDVGDLSGAAAQVAEARSAAGDRTLGYVEQWNDLIGDEHKRRRGVRISRLDQLTAISATYRQLVCGDDAVSQAISVTSIGVVAAVTLVATAMSVIR